MIQRPQSIILVINIILLVVHFFLPLWTVINESFTAIVMPYEIQIIANDSTVQKSIAYIALMPILLILSNAIQLFKYKNRPLQMKLGAVNSLLTGGYIVLVLLFVIPMARELANTELEGDYRIGVFLLVAVVLMNIISNRLIKRDHDLVKSVDRIR